MTFPEVAGSYIDTYLQREALDANPLLEPGALEAEAQNIIGTTTIEKIRAYDQTAQQVDTTLAEIAALDVLLADLGPQLLQYMEDFETSGITFIEKGKKISIEDGELIVSDAF